MRYRRFGRTGWQVSEIGYGMWGMGGWTGSDDDESLRALGRAIALGCNFFGTAWADGQGRSEQLPRQALPPAPATNGDVATKIPRTSCSRTAGSTTSRSSRAYRLTKAASPER